MSCLRFLFYVELTRRLAVDFSSFMQIGIETLGCGSQLDLSARHDATGYVEEFFERNFYKTSRGASLLE